MKIANKDNTKAKKINHIFCQIFHFFVNLFIIAIQKISNNSAIIAKKRFSVIVSIIVNIANETMNSIYFYGYENKFFILLSPFTERGWLKAGGFLKILSPARLRDSSFLKGAQNSKYS